MAGNTGKMTNEAIIARGPRMRLLAVYSGVSRIGFVVMRDPNSPVGLGTTKLERPSYRTYANSYSLGYLLRIGSAQLCFEEAMGKH